MTNETWKPVPNYEGLYEVSDLGNVRSLDRVVKGRTGGPRRLKGRPMSVCSASYGYLGVGLCKLGKSRFWAAHRLVALAHCEGRSEASNQVNHLDGDKTNNKASNLAWVTSLENHLHASETGLRPSGISRKLAVNQAHEVRWLYAGGGVSMKALAVEYGLNVASIHDLIHCKTYRSQLAWAAQEGLAA